MAQDLMNTREMAIRQLLDKLLGDQKPIQGDDSIQETDSPIDYLAAAYGPGLVKSGVNLGRALASDAPAILGNEIGSIGVNVKPSPLSVSKDKFAKLREKLEPMLREKGAISDEAGKFANEAVINKELQNIAQRGVETGKMSPLDLEFATQNSNRSLKDVELMKKALQEKKASQRAFLNKE